jgi:hypothetical protein
LERSGFLKGHSNYIFFSSKKISDLMKDFYANQTRAYFNRGDGDGPLNL